MNEFVCFFVVEELRWFSKSIITVEIKFILYLDCAVILCNETIIGTLFRYKGDITYISFFMSNSFYTCVFVGEFIDRDLYYVNQMTASLFMNPDHKVYKTNLWKVKLMHRNCTTVENVQIYVFFSRIFVCCALFGT